MISVALTYQMSMVLTFNGDVFEAVPSLTATGNNIGRCKLVHVFPSRHLSARNGMRVVPDEMNGEGHTDGLIGIYTSN